MHLEVCYLPAGGVGIVNNQWGRRHHLRTIHPTHLRVQWSACRIILGLPADHCRRPYLDLLVMLKLNAMNSALGVTQQVEVCCWKCNIWISWLFCSNSCSLILHLIRFCRYCLYLLVVPVFCLFPVKNKYIGICVCFFCFSPWCSCL